MAIFESGVRGGRGAVDVKFVSGVADAGGIRSPMDRIGRAHVARHPVERSRGAFGEAFLAISRLVFPVLLLVTAAVAAFIYGNEPVRWLGNNDVGGKPFFTGLLAPPLMLFIVQLTNRRYGAAYAFAQVAATSLVVMGIAGYMPDDLMLLRGGDIPETRLVAAFGIGLLVSQLLSIFVFDRLRGPYWWQAPLFASFLGGIAFCLVAYPVAYAGTGVGWFQPMTGLIGLNSAAAIVLVVPYWFLRAVVEPLPGFGGY